MPLKCGECNIICTWDTNAQWAAQLLRALRAWSLRAKSWEPQNSSLRLLQIDHRMISRFKVLCTPTEWENKYLRFIKINRLFLQRRNSPQSKLLIEDLFLEGISMLYRNTTCSFFHHFYHPSYLIKCIFNPFFWLTESVTGYSMTNDLCWVNKVRSHSEIILVH